MWETNSLWFEVAMVSIGIALGHILLGHFEERTPRSKKLVKYLFALVLIVSISFFFGRLAAIITYVILFIPVIYVHLILLPRKGINGWTGEPKSKYYEYRKWSKDIFNTKN